MVAYRNTLYDFIRRTKQNLETIESGSKAKPNEYFEVTQLINSVVGLLMFPKEAVYEEIPATPLDELRQRGVPLPTILHGKLKEDTLKQLIRYMRNGFAHYHVHFDSPNNEIRGIYLWNETPKKVVDWVVYISIADLRSLLDLASREFKKITESSKETDSLEQLEKKLGFSIPRP
jgi:hypothetical protein